MTTHLRVLLVEDNAGDARLLREMLREPGSGYHELTWLGSMRSAEKHLLTNPADIILLDLGLPDARGIEAVRRVHEAASNVPLVVLTGLDDEETACAALHEGAQDYLVKGQIDTRSLLRSLRHAVERKQMEESLWAEKERAQVTLNSIGDAVVSSDDAGKVTFINSVAEAMCNWSLAEAIGRPVTEVIRLAADASVIDGLAARHDVPRAGHAMLLRSNCVLIDRSGTELPIEGSVSPIYDRRGGSSGEVMVFRDASASRADSLRMAHSARHDFLTGLPNRMLFDDRVESAISIAPRHNKKVAVLFLDLDGFKHVNDSLGHHMGDKLLQSVATRLQDCVRISDTVCRRGGDEFTVLLSEVEHAEDAGISARRMLAAIAEPHLIDHHELRITASIGISIFPEDGEDVRALVQNADTAMYLIKEGGRQNFQFFRANMNLRAQERQSIEESLRRGLERGEFAVHYQPKINLLTGLITGAEALLRWTHPTLGLVAPARFIPAAEDSGLMLPIGAWVLREACMQAKIWSDTYLADFTISVNVSALQFRHEQFLPEVFDVLSQTGLKARALELELPECVLIRHDISTASLLSELRAKGVRVALDDFGTGYSSLGHLHRFPVDTLKIDRSFVHEIAGAGRHANVVRAVIGLARSLNLRVVAEGVETPEELAFLRKYQCDDAQGFYLGHPLPAEEFVALLETGRQSVVFA